MKWVVYVLFVLITLTGCSSDDEEVTTGGAAGGGEVAATPAESAPAPDVRSSVRYHHYNPKAWHGKGSAIVLCNGDRADWCKVSDGRFWAEHGSRDKGRYIYSRYSGTRYSGTITCEIRGKIYEFNVSGSGNIQYGNCNT